MQGSPLSLLFVLVMDALAGMFRVAGQHGILANLDPDGIQHRVSMYADDVAVFSKPDEDELRAVCGIVAYFGKALGFAFPKNTAAPIRCSLAPPCWKSLPQPWSAPSWWSRTLAWSPALRWTASEVQCTSSPK